MAEITRLFLFIHFIMPRDAARQNEFMTKWRDLVNTEGPKPDTAICILSCTPQAVPNELAELNALVKERFGDRAVFDPCDESAPTKILLAEDLLRMLRRRGWFADWIPYEIWTSGWARRWTEGLKRELRERGHTYVPETLRVVACGQQWAACLTKHAMLMSSYLGVTQTPEVRVDLSTDAGWPLQGARFVERVAMERHVSLFLFETADGRPMGQYLDGLRAIWEPPHVAVVTINPDQVELRMDFPNVNLVSQPSAGAGLTRDGIIADVGDGCQPRLTTIIGRKGSMRDFKATLAGARIEPRPAKQITNEKKANRLTTIAAALETGKKDAPLSRPASSQTKRGCP